MQAVEQTLVDEGVEELHLVRAAFEHGVDDILHHRLHALEIVVQIGEGHLRLDHPELGGVALGVGDLGAEGGAEGVHIAEGHGKVFGVELTGDGQVGGLSEKVLAEIDAAGLLAGRVVGIQGGDTEHLSGALGVGAGDDGRVDIDKAAVLEEFMHRRGRDAAHAEGGGEEVGAGAQMLDRAQKLHTVALLLQRVIRRGDALHLNGLGLELKGLLGLRGQHQGAADD